jgi:hypothetical protein
MKLPDIVPLSAQVLAQLRRLQAITGNHRYLFPSLQRLDSVMSENTIGKALRKTARTQAKQSSHQNTEICASHATHHASSAREPRKLPENPQESTDHAARCAPLVNG